LSYEDRKGVLAFSEFDGDLETGDLELPKDGTVIRDVEFSIKAAIANYNAKTHQRFTKEAATVHLGSSTDELERGSAWPDFPVMFRTMSWSVIQLRYVELLPFGFAYSISEILPAAAGSFIGGCMYDSHFGVRQHWHSMYPQFKGGRPEGAIKDEIIESIELLGINSTDANYLKPKIMFSNGILTNNSVREIILMQCKKWYEEAIKCKNEWLANNNWNKKKESHFYLGKLCHVVQDSYVLAHSWRRYIGDRNFVNMSEINPDDNGKIWTFQDYKAQDTGFHTVADSPFQEDETQPYDVDTIGYNSALEATNGIMKKYNSGLEWDQMNANNLKSYLENIYQIYPGRENMPSGGSHHWFKKLSFPASLVSFLKIPDVKKNLYAFSSAIRGKENDYITRIRSLR
jgi:hypothetical protein